MTHSSIHHWGYSEKYPYSCVDKGDETCQTDIYISVWNADELEQNAAAG